ncbi:MAG: histidine kinase dimerization/phospho-acceptor domain-containing protein [Cyclobacteriaceae bacterium]
MRVALTKILIGEKEVEIFRHALLIFLGLQVIQIFIGLSTHGLSKFFYFNTAFLLLILAAYVFSRSKVWASIITFFLIALSYCFLVWNHTGGWNGNMLYTITVLVLLIAVVMDGMPLILMLSIYAISLGVLYSGLLGFTPDNEALVPYLEIDFLLKTGFLITITMIHKLQFVEYKKSVEAVNKKLTESNALKEQQQALLSKRKEELHAIKTNLSEVIEEKVLEVKEKSSTLRTYAFRNAHEVRAPLAKILGILHLVEMEATPDTKEQLNLMKAETVKMDKILRQINDVVKSD